MNLDHLDNLRITSLELAQLTGKSHRHLLRDIRKMEKSWVESGEPKFGLSSYKTSQNREMPMYKLSKKETLFIATKFDDLMRAKLINRWEHLEKSALVSPENLTRMDILEMAIDSEKGRLAALEKIEELEPKADMFNRVLNLDNLLSMGEVAKLLQLPFGRNKLFKKLRESGVLFADSNEPKQKYIDEGLFVVKEVIKKKKAYVKTMVTQRGLEYIGRMFESKVILPDLWSYLAKNNRKYLG